MKSPSSFSNGKSHLKNNQLNQSTYSQQDNKKTTINKISNFLQMKQIPIQQFWTSNRNYASSQDLLSFCSKCGLRLTVHDDISLKLQLFSKREVISIYDFCQEIYHWRKEGQQMILNFLKSRSEELVEQIESKKDKSRAQSISAIKRVFSGKPNEQKKNKTPRGHSALSKPCANSAILSLNNASSQVSGKLKKQTFTANNSYDYLQKHRERQVRMEKALAETIDKTKNEYEYSMLLKMGQANEIAKQTQSPFTFRAYKNAEGNIKVRVFNYNNVEKQITLKQFERDYKSLKKKNKQNKQWEYGMATPLNRKFGKDQTLKIRNNSLTIQTKNIASANDYETKNIKKAQRQQELRNLLVNTVNLTNLLKEQIKIFKMKGIHGCQQI